MTYNFGGMRFKEGLVKSMGNGFSIRRSSDGFARVVNGGSGLFIKEDAISSVADNYSKLLRDLVGRKEALNPRQIEALLRNQFADDFFYLMGTHPLWTGYVVESDFNEKNKCNVERSDGTVMSCEDFISVEDPRFPNHAGLELILDNKHVAKLNINNEEFVLSREAFEEFTESGRYLILSRYRYQRDSLKRLYRIFKQTKPIESSESGSLRVAHCRRESGFDWVFFIEKGIIKQAFNNGFKNKLKGPAK